MLIFKRAQVINHYALQFAFLFVQTVWMSLTCENLYHKCAVNGKDNANAKDQADHKSASIAQWLENRQSNPAVTGSSPGWDGHICACHVEVKITSWQIKAMPSSSLRKLLIACSRAYLTPYVSCVTIELVSRVSGTRRAVQPQKTVRVLKFPIYVVEEHYIIYLAKTKVLISSTVCKFNK